MLGWRCCFSSPPRFVSSSWQRQRSRCDNVLHYRVSAMQRECVKTRVRPHKGFRLSGLMRFTASERRTAMRRHHFWLADEQSAMLRPHIPRPGQAAIFAGQLAWAITVVRRGNMPLATALVATLHASASRIARAPRRWRRVSQTTSGGMTSHCRSGLSPVPKGGTIGIRSEYVQRRLTLV